MFRCAEPGFISNLFTTAGLTNVSEKDVPCPLTVNGPAEYWDFQTQVAAPVVAALANVDEATRNAIKADVLALMQERYPNGNVQACARVIVGVK